MNPDRILEEIGRVLEEENEEYQGEVIHVELPRAIYREKFRDRAAALVMRLSMHGIVVLPKEEYDGYVTASQRP